MLPEAFARDPDLAERFRREARTLARLSHQNVVAVHDFGEFSEPPELAGRPYLVMELVDGVSLREVLREGPIEPVRALRIVGAICDALEYAHGEGVVHRDIKPENVLLDRKGRVKVADFGLAKLVGERGPATPLTRSRDVMGTPHYMAPEQIESTRDVDHRADLYALGVLFYEVLTGELPLGRFEPPSRRVAVDVRLDEVVLRALERSPERRYQSASEIKEAITRHAATPAAPEPGLRLDDLLLTPADVPGGWALTSRFQSIDLPYVARPGTLDRSVLLQGYGAAAGVTPEHVAGGAMYALGRKSPRRRPSQFFLVLEFADLEARARLRRWLITQSRPSGSLLHVVLEGDRYLVVGHLYSLTRPAMDCFARVVTRLESAGLTQTYRTPPMGLARAAEAVFRMLLVVALIAALLAGVGWFISSLRRSARPSSRGNEAAGIHVGDTGRSSRFGLRQEWSATGPLSPPAVLGDSVYVSTGDGHVLEDGKELAGSWGRTTAAAPAVGSAGLFLALAGGEGLLQLRSGSDPVVWSGAFGEGTPEAFAVDGNGRALAWLAEGRELVLARRDGVIHRWPAPEPTEVAVDARLNLCVSWSREPGGSLEVHDAGSGRSLWAREGILAAPVLFPDALVAALGPTDAPRVEAFEPVSGRPLWQAAIEPGVREILGHGNSLRVLGIGPEGATVVRLPAHASGPVVTVDPSETIVFPGIPPLRGSAVAGSVLYARHADGEGLIALDLEDEWVLFTWRAPAGVRISAPVVDRGRVIVSGSDGIVRVFAAADPHVSGWPCERGNGERTGE